MKRKEVAVETALASIPDWVLRLAPPPEELMPPIPPMDPAFCFPEEWWVRISNDGAAADLRRRWLAKHAPDLTSRQVWAEAQRRRTERTAL
ncbi:hypothetical protein JOD57_003493 [Geodermatophilus bullaregiensis]|uniref:hypothetical protein n=1 Tax=Geodermatophilus bullaregiensis TaxID=1564160 RepID=UPI00195A55E1|nr:hypothetical protein [Geodermatophilus bullaregiensis]MBM7807656.1 hypothetical protein [Geodermatophilus bullaregiensis]